MLKLIDPLMTPDLLYVLQAMGHGDDLVICDRNHPATTIVPKLHTDNCSRFLELRFPICRKLY